MYIRYFPEHVASLSLLGELYGKDLGDLARSKEYLTKAYAISPKSTDVLIKLGTAHAMTGDFKTALNLFLLRPWPLTLPIKMPCLIWALLI